MLFNSIAYAGGAPCWKICSFFFPRLVAGAIERSDNLLSQINKASKFDAFDECFADNNDLFSSADYLNEKGARKFAYILLNETISREKIFL